MHALRLRLSAALLLVALLSTACDARAEKPPRPLRIATFNCEILAAPSERVLISKYRFNIARRRQFERIAAVIETLNPDIVALQEVTSKDSVDLLVEILHEKGLKRYRGYHVDGHDNFMKIDCAFLTKIEPDVVESKTIRMFHSSRGDDSWRAEFTYIGYEGDEKPSDAAIDRHSVFYVTVAGQKLGFLNLHLKSNPDDNYANGRRTAEATVAQRIVKQQIVARGYTPIVLGDLNDYDSDVPDYDEGRDTKTKVLSMLKDFDPEQDGPELVNVAARIARRLDRYTSHWDRNENGADDIGDVKTMLDHILLSKKLMPHVERVFISHAHHLETSDHFPVVVDLALPSE